jgi:hypothetical protein
MNWRTVFICSDPKRKQLWLSEHSNRSYIRNESVWPARRRSLAAFCIDDYGRKIPQCNPATRYLKCRSEGPSNCKKDLENIHSTDESSILLHARMSKWYGVLTPGSRLNWV